MKRWLILCAALTLALAAVAHAASPGHPAAAKPPMASSTTAVAASDDPDLPGALAPDIDKEAYLQMRESYMRLRFDDANYEQIVTGRLNAVEQLKRQVGQQAPFVSFGTWTAIGPYPIPNGQTTSISTAVSGRVSAIAVHPTNPDVVYVGLAQGGVWRSMDGGLNWTPLFDKIGRAHV